MSYSALKTKMCEPPHYKLIGMMVIAKQTKDRTICGALKNCPCMYICLVIILSSILKTKVIAL